MLPIYKVRTTLEDYLPVEMETFSAVTTHIILHLTFQAKRSATSLVTIFSKLKEAKENLNLIMYKR